MQELQIQLAPNFTLGELLVTSSGLDNWPATRVHFRNLVTTAQHAQSVRDLLQRPVIITSAYRSPAVNRAVGGSATSDHANGLAYDFRVPNMDGYDVANAVFKSSLNFDQLIWYRRNGGQIVHIGLGSRMRRQVLTNPHATGVHNLLTGLVRA